jgi:hypothetical protein
MAGYIIITTRNGRTENYGLLNDATVYDTRQAAEEVAIVLRNLGCYDRVMVHYCD